MCRQSWSLQGRHLPLCLWSRYVSEDDKSSIAASITGFLPPLASASATSEEGAAASSPSPPRTINKPAFPDLACGSKLADFVTEESTLLFTRAIPDWRWLYKPPSEWKSDAGYQGASKIVHAIVSTNDPAERLCGMAKKYRVITKQFSFGIFRCVVASL